jgi:DNA-directed RNA polymerase specialized sigma24 family protein
VRDLGELLAAYAEHGDEEALVAQTRPALLRAVRHLPDGEDAVQAAYLALLRARPRTSVSGWLHATAVRIAYRRLARARRRHRERHGRPRRIPRRP